jgi:hypothetical protein
MDTTLHCKGQIDLSTPAQPYTPPVIVYEAPLEVRAGTPLGMPDPLNLPDAGK